MYSATSITSKGQVTIPKPVREKLNIKTGDFIQVQNLDSNNQSITLKVIPSENVVQLLSGSLKSKKSYIPLSKVRDIAGKKLGEKYDSK